MRGEEEEEEEEEEEVHPEEVLPPTVEELSEWRSPPPQRPSAQTQTGPAGRQRRGTKERREVKNRHEEAKTPGKQKRLVTSLNFSAAKEPFGKTMNLVRLQKTTTLKISFGW